ncbi:OsmC family peroxiredoxin [Brumimicrobium oceani]|uniref:OsmC family peroxiredoxin n=1 Tax=Brumimicrobium oceani TaxID=2100725 RepID=A0A2U2XE79_9FLAO|nr:OsmC family peroxiredoxin [Brumimicrobium oceani]PWH86109.1 OsmC family peroxiredoxin [Brumimicrobium oceani]
MERKATALWRGGGKEGKGHLTTQSKVLDQTNYSYKSRFEEGEGTNPEELIAAAHAGCFTMKLTFNLQEAGFTANSLETCGSVQLEDGKVVSSNLKLAAKVDGIKEEEFSKLAEDAKQNCPISLLLDTRINLEYTLSN